MVLGHVDQQRTLGAMDSHQIRLETIFRQFLSQSGRNQYVDFTAFSIRFFDHALCFQAFSIIVDDHSPSSKSITRWPNAIARWVPAVSVCSIRWIGIERFFFFRELQHRRVLLQNQQREEISRLHQFELPSFSHLGNVDFRPADSSDSHFQPCGRCRWWRYSRHVHAARCSTDDGSSGNCLQRKTVGRFSRTSGIDDQ